MNIPDGFVVENIIPKSISKNDLSKIHEIEQDMWAQGIGEYVKCSCCNTIYGKKDIFGYLSKDIYQKTVQQIEQTLALDSIKCHKCDSDTDHIWGKDYIEDIKERYNDDQSFLTILRDNEGKIQGFSDGYINNFNTIYKREFEYYYSNIGEDSIREKIEDIILKRIPKEILLHSTVGIENKYSNLEVFLLLLKEFYLNLRKLGYEDILGIYESTIGTIIHSIYHSAGAKRILTTKDKVIEKDLVYNKSENHISDIFVHQDIVTCYNFKLDVSIKDFMKINSIKMKEVLDR